MQTKHSIEDLQTSVSIVDVVSRYRTLVKNGKNFKALCPFHDDKSPSLVVNPIQNFCWCFACQNGGNVFSFVQKIEGCSFPDAIKIVAEIGGQNASDYLFDTEKTPEEQKELSKKKEYKERLREVLEETQNFFVHQFTLDKNLEAQKYVYNIRKFSDEIVKKFGIGFAPNSYSELREYLLKKKFSRKEMLDAGVVVGELDNSENKDVIDKYRNRIMFPILDSLGKICGFGGRILGDGMPKYLNSPESELYDKSKNLYGFYEAKNAIRKNDEILFVEGNLDVMACHQFGIENVVAISGVGFSEFQAKLAKRFTTNTLLGLDNDEAGIKATERMLPVLFAQNLSVKTLEISEEHGKDPDEILQKNKEIFVLAMKNAKPAIDVLLRNLKNKYTADGQEFTVDKKRKILEIVFPMVASHTFNLEKKSDLKNISNVLQIDEITLNDEFNAFTGKKQTSVMRGRKVKNKKDLSNIHELPKKSYFWGVLLKFFGEMTYVFSIIDASFFATKEEKELYSLLNIAYNESRKISMREELHKFSSEFQDDLMRSMLYADQHLGQLSASQRKDEIKNLVHAVGENLVVERFNFFKNVITTDPSIRNIQQFQFYANALKKIKTTY